MNSLNIVAHPDDDLLFLNPDILQDLSDGLEPYILYLTAGDDGRDEAYVDRRIQAVEHAWGPRVSDNLMFWKIKSNCFRTGDKLGDLYHLYNDIDYRANSFDNTETYSRELVSTSLRALSGKLKPAIIRVQDPFAEPAIEADGKDLDHIDHVYGAKLVVMSLWNVKAKMFAYTGYPIRHKAPNVEMSARDKKQELWRRYQSIETEVAGEQWDIAMDRCYKTKI